MNIDKKYKFKCDSAEKELKNVLCSIEKMRETLNSILEYDEGHVSSEYILSLSKQLDELLNRYLKLIRTTRQEQQAKSKNLEIIKE